MKLYTLLENEKTLSLPGIYQIINDNTGKFYIGSTSNPVKDRVSQHFSYLRANTHANKKLQNSYNKHTESAFSIRVLETFICSKKECQKIGYLQEQKYIDLYNSVENGYNINRKAEKPNPREFTEQDRIEESLKRSEGGYLISFPESEDTYFVPNLKLFIEAWPEYNLDDRGLTACARAEISNHKGFKVKFANPAKQKEYVSKYDQREEAFVLFDPDGNRYVTNNLSKFCREHGLEDNRVSLLLCAQGKNYHSAGWQCHYIKNAPEKYIPTDKLANRIKYLIFDPQGNQYSTQNLTKFCQEHNLKENPMRCVSLPNTKNKSYKGWTCFRDDQTLTNRDEIVKYKGKVPIFKYQVSLPDGTLVKGKSITQLEKDLGFNRDILARMFRNKAKGKPVKKGFDVFVL